MKDVLTPLEMRTVDMNTEYNHIPTIVLMENAGSRIANYIIRNFSDKRKVSIYSGTGGNGGDGFVIARHLLNYDFKVRLFLLAKPEAIRNKDSMTNFKSIKIIAETDKNLSLNVITDSSMVKPDNSDIIVDAILGTGVNGKLREPASSAIDVINNSPAIVLSVDVPSGMDPLTGNVYDKCVVAAQTLTLHKVKTGLLCAQAGFTGKISVLDIGIPRVSEEYVGSGDLLRIKSRLSNSHKGENGSVLIVGSNPDYVGAVIFAGRAALAGGVDLVYIVAPESSADIIKQDNPEFIVRSVSGDVLSVDAYDDIMELAGRVDSVLLGSGAGVDNKTCELFSKLLDNLEGTVVLDADALKLVDKNSLKENVIVTPHNYEFKQLFGVDVPDDLDGKVELISSLSEDFHTTILLKGVVDVIAFDGDYKLNRTGNAGMTIGGTGDVLAGLVLAFSSKLSPFEASFLAVFKLCVACDKLYIEGSYRIEDILKELQKGGV